MSEDDEQYAQGGYIGDPGNDSVPVMIHPGESWITADMARQYGIEMLRKLTGGEVHVMDEADDE